MTWDFVGFMLCLFAIAHGSYLWGHVDGKKAGWDAAFREGERILQEHEEANR